MEDIIIELSNVLNLEELNINVIEEILDENTALYLNHDQISTEITSLLINKYKWNNLRRKTNLYLKILNENSTTINYDMLKPIIKVNKIISYDSFKPDNIYSPDIEWDKDHFVIGELLTEFIKKYNLLNTDVANPYLQTSIKLYEFYKPFSTISNRNLYNISFDTDAYRHSLIDKGSCMQYNGNYDLEIIRLIKNINDVYDGDKIDLFGFYNKINNKDEYEIFDIDNYINSLKQFKVNDSIILYFNDFAFFNNKIIETINGTISECTDKYILISLEKEIKFKNIMTKILYYYINRFTNPYFIYATTSNQIYHKSKLITTNIAFKIRVSKQIKYITPNTINELVYINRHNISNIYNLEDLKTLNIPADLLNNLLLSIIYNKKFKKVDVKLSDFNHGNVYINNIKILKHITHFKTTYIDTYLNRFIYLINNTNYGYKELLTIIKNNLSNLLKFIDKKKLQQKLDNQEEIKKIKPSQKGVISKEYDSLEELEEDNNKEIFFDKKYDKTLYHLKNLKLSALKSKLAELDVDDIDYEITSINESERKVRIGDYALLNPKNECKTIPQKQITFVRRLVSGEEMWIKMLSVPFPTCNNKLEKYEDLVKDETLILDPFDLICKKNKDFKKNIQYLKLVNENKYISDIIDFVDNYDSIEKDIKEELEFYNYLPEDIYTHRHLYHIITHYEYDTGYEDFLGSQETDINELYNKTEFGENRTILYKKNIVANMDNSDILETLTHLCDINLSDIHIKYILESVNLKFPKKITDILDDIKKAIDKQKITLLKDVTEEGKKKIVERIEVLLKNKEIEAKQKYYKDVILHITTLLILVLIAQYPTLLIKQIYPRCLQYFSYIGYPLVNDINKSLTKYFACILVNIGSPNDLKFGIFNNMKVDEVEILLKKITDELLELKTDLKKFIDLNKNNLLKKQHVIKDNSKYNTLNTFFKPSFEFNNLDTKNNTLYFLKEIYTVVKKNPVLRINIFNNPTIINACCMEKISNNINYYDFFKKDHVSLLEKKDVNDYKTITYKPLYTKTNVENVFVYRKIHFPNLPLIEPKKEEFIEPQKKYDINYDDLIIIFKNVMNDIKNDESEIIEDLLVNITSYNNISNIRFYLYTFMTTKLKTIIGKITNQYKFTKKISENDTYNYDLALLLDQISKYNNYIELLSEIKNIFTFNLDIDVLYIDEKKAILFLTNQLFTLFNMFLELSTDMNIKSQTCEIISYILKSLTNYLISNDLKLATIKSSMEKLREIYKQKLMEKYSKDDEERSYQMQLKNMGDNVILKVDVNGFDEELRNVENPVIAQDDIPDIGYHGENADDDADYNEYAVIRED
jgi:hypothetical protein